MCSVKPQNDLSHKGQAVEEWADLHFFRPIGIRIARALQPTGISADQVTLWSLVIGLVAGHLFAYQDRWTNVIGFVLFIVSDIFDSADGQLARLRGRSTRFGRALDGISDNLRFVNLDRKSTRLNSSHVEISYAVFCLKKKKKKKIKTSIYWK